MILILTTSLLLNPTLTLADTPADYYQHAQGLSGLPLKSALHAIIDNHAVLPYISSGSIRKFHF